MDPKGSTDVAGIKASVVSAASSGASLVLVGAEVAAAHSVVCDSSALGVGTACSAEPRNHPRTDLAYKGSPGQPWPAAARLPETSNARIVTHRRHCPD